ncbi:MAG: phosphoglucosamine mutase [Bacteroidia bacterium]|nr:phosphoglucosamine mutase [Bacteroidia bacterium]
MTLIKSVSGIRGTLGGKISENLTPPDIVKYTQAFAHLLRLKYPRIKKIKVLVGRDGRISGEVVSSLVVSTLRMSGIDVFDAGLSTTPSVEMGVTEYECHGGIILTASHNPYNWNALKLLNESGEFISEEDGKKLLELAEANTFEYADVLKLGGYKAVEDVMDLHVKKILRHPLVNASAIKKKNFTLVCDTINSTGSLVLQKLFKEIGIKNYYFLHEEVNGHFAHNPEPLPEHLNDLSKEVKRRKADLGIAVDPDVDRLVLVCEDGEFFGEEYTLVAVADYVLGKTGKGGKTVSNLSSSRALADVTARHGGEYFASKVGEVHVVKKMKEVNAIIGGEGNGGVIVPDLHYGRDAVAGIALMLSFLAEQGKPASQIRKSYPNYYMSKSKIELQPEWDVDEVLERVCEKYKKNKPITEDGVKIIFDNEWVHLRKSNTEPIIRIYTESTSQSMADNLAKKFIQDIGAVVKELIID